MVKEHHPRCAKVKFPDGRLRSTRLFSLAGALTPMLFLGLWWLPAIPFGYWFLNRLVAILPTATSLAKAKAREEEALFFLAALSGSLKSGLPLLRALENVIPLLQSSLKGDLERSYSLLLLGAQPDQAWSVLREDRQLAPFGSAVARAQVDGRSIAKVVERISTECYETTLKISRQRVKSLSVKLSLPVGLCFLPSFLIGGIGPIVYYFFASLRLF